MGCVSLVLLHVGEKHLVVFSSRVLVDLKAREYRSLPRTGPGQFLKASLIWNLKCLCERI